MRQAELASLRNSLLEWYDRHQRHLPWRSAPGAAPDPYAVWLSEVMLQQTRVETVRPYFDRWMERFPGLAEVAAASQDEILKEWEGLGYYSRARNFHRAVREVVDRYGGEVPREPEAFRALPGVGRYTAGAVMSIAFARPEPVVDGNVRRVFARWTDTAEPGDPDLWALAGRLVEGDRPGDLNQALMELGATVCTPRSPDCGRCPVSAGCRAFAEGTQAARPARRSRAQLPVEHHGVAVTLEGERVLLTRRAERGRLAGLWEFPGARQSEGESAITAAARAVREIAGLEVGPGTAIAVVPQVFSHVRVIYAAFEMPIRGTAAGSGRGDWRWVGVAELGGYALSRAQRRISALMGWR